MTSSKLVNSSLVLVAILAWTSAQNNQISNISSVAALLIGIMVSAFVLIRKYHRPDGRKDTPQNEGVAVTKWSEDHFITIENLKTLHYAKGSNARTDSFTTSKVWSQLVAKESSRISIPGSNKSRALPINNGCHSIRHTNDFVDISPKDPENYSVRIGQVLIEVKNGNASVNVDTGKTTDGTDIIADLPVDAIGVISAQRVLN